MLSVSMHMQNLFLFHQFVLEILSWNEILKSIKGYNSVINVRKLTRYSPNLDLVYINAYAKFDQIPSICSQDIEWKRNLDIIQVNDSVINLRKLIGNNPIQHLPNINAYAKFGQIPSILSHDILTSIKGHNSLVKTDM